LCRECCFEFDKAIEQIYSKEFLRLPTAADLRNIVALHKAVHHVDGMLGSLDCSHTFWKNCPKAWQGSYKGKEKAASIVMEAVSDYNLYLWYISYGYPGTLNDKNILNVSPMLERMIDGSLHELEKEAGITPFEIGEEQFTLPFLLVDGIYYKYSRFVQGVTHPIEEVDKRYTAWQEASRKDVERAFAVLKKKFQFLDRPILLHSIGDVARRVTTCFILHNMCVSERVMDGDCRATYNPCNNIILPEEATQVSNPTDLVEVQAAFQTRLTRGITNVSSIGARNVPKESMEALTDVDRWKDLCSKEENSRLHKALKSVFGRSDSNRMS
jgi:hypothetical protein